jgi:hypothetical protein
MKQEKEQTTTSAVALPPVMPKKKKIKYKDFDVPTEGFKQEEISLRDGQNILI